MTFDPLVIPFADSREPARRWSLAAFQVILLRLAMVGLFTAMLAATDTYAWQHTGVFLALLAVFPSMRRALLVAAGLLFAYLMPPVNHWLIAQLATDHGPAGEWVSIWPAGVGIALVFGVVLCAAFRRYPRSIAARRPLLTLLAVLVSLLVVVTLAPLTGPAWVLAIATTMALGNYLWFFAYAARDVRRRRAGPILGQAGYWRPMWGFSNVPMGKGSGYLERVEARDAAGLGATQVSGMKLMLWAMALAVINQVLIKFLYEAHSFGTLLSIPFFWLPGEGLPSSAMALERHLAGDPYPISTRWAALLAEFVFTYIGMAAWGHKVIAICRMAGFNVAPNTDRPLTATSIADYFNRNYYYFKELLATFFFYPTYACLFKGWPRLRVFTATLAAAGLGNFLFHFLRDDRHIFRSGLRDALVEYHVYAFYCLVVGVAIALSQVRLMKRRPAPAGWHKVAAIAGVWLFYSLANLFGGQATPHNLAEHGSYFLSLFNVR